MTTTQKYAAWGVGAVVLVLAGRAALDEHDARIKAEAQTAVLQKTIADNQQVINQAKADAVQAQANLAVQLQAINAQRTVVVTPQQAAIDVSKILPSLPQPVQVQSVPATATAPATQAIVVPQADIPAFQTYHLDCQENAAKLNACQLTSADQTTELKATQNQLEAMTTERDDYKKAVKGTFWQKLGKSAKCLSLSAVGSALGAAADKQSPALGAGIGAVAGNVTCQLWR